MVKLLRGKIYCLVFHMSKQAFHWKMMFNPDPSKQAIETCFSHKHNNKNYPSMVLDNTKVQLTTSQKHLGLILDFFNPVKKYLANNIKILR